MGPEIENHSPSKMLLLVETIQEFVTGIKTITERKEVSDEQKELYAVDISNLFKGFYQTMNNSPEFLQNLRFKIATALEKSVNVEGFSSVEVHD
jgi:hypothetical protein